MWRAERMSGCQSRRRKGGERRDEKATRGSNLWCLQKRERCLSSFSVYVHNLQLRILVAFLSSLGALMGKHKRSAKARKKEKLKKQAKTQAQDASQTNVPRSMVFRRGKVRHVGRKMRCDVRVFAFVLRKPYAAPTHYPGHLDTHICARVKVGALVIDLVKNMRMVMAPNTAARLKERQRNQLKDFVHVASTLSVSHFMIFSQTEGRLLLLCLVCVRAVSFCLASVSPRFPSSQHLWQSE